MRPFLPAIVWAMTLVIATWPLMLRVQRRAGNRRGLAVLVMTIALLLVLIVPFWLAISTIVANSDEIVGLVRTLQTLRMPPPPSWMADVPLVGARVTRVWEQLTSAGMEELAPKLTPYVGVPLRWFASAVGGLGGTFVQFLLTVAIAAVMYAGGERAAATVIRCGRWLGGERGETAWMFILCLAQIGPALVLIPAVAWMYYSGDALWATVLLAFSLVAMIMDNFLRPVLIRKGAHLPLLLILAGVIGGLLAMCPLGIFLGPTVLAVGYTLLNAWMAEGDEAEPPVAAP